MVNAEIEGQRVQLSTPHFSPFSDRVSMLRVMAVRVQPEAMPERRLPDDLSMSDRLLFCSVIRALKRSMPP